LLQTVVESIHSWIWRYLRPYRGRIAGLALLSCTEVALRVLSPWPLKAVVDYVVNDRALPPIGHSLLDPFLAVFSRIDGRRERMLCAIVFAGLTAQVLHQFVMVLHSRLQTGTGHRMVRDLRERLFAHVQAMTLAQHQKTPSAQLLYRLEADAACLEHLVLRGVFPITFSMLTLGAMFTILVFIDHQLAFVSLGVVPVLFLWLRFYTGRMQPAAGNAKHRESAMVQRLHESLGAVRLIKTYAREDYEQARFCQAAGDALQARLTTSKQESLFAAVVTTLTITGTAIVILIGGLSVLSGRISLGTLLLLIAYLGFVYAPLCGIANTTGGLQQAVASARRVCETFTLATEPADAAHAVDATGIRGEVVFERVSFAYDDGPTVLEDVSFRVAPGQMAAIVGLSGAGKTTMVSLIVRLFEATGGRILIDGRDVRDYRLKSLREHASLVWQETVMLTGTIRENLRFGRSDATDQELEAAARAAHAHEFIVNMKHGYDTVIGEAGNGLSGGQKQRIGIARALVKNAPILILDEPTGALDSISEAKVFEGLHTLQRGRTTFVIAHTLATVRAADIILVLDKGRLVGQGTHEELVASSPLYRRMASQLVGTDAPPRLARAV
jgi:ABC-type multidrug transport system fused ATPase/permease subunit